MSAATTVVTGAGSGIGAATAFHVAEHGDHVVVADNRPDAARAVADQVRAAGGSAEAVHLDVGDPASCAALFGGLAGRVATGLVNCAGITTRSAFVDLDLAAWRKVLDTNLTGTMLMSQHLVRQLGDRSGAIVNVASVMAHFAAPNLLPYVSSKGGVAMLTRALAVELAERNVRVNAVSPGYVESGMTDKVFRVARFADAVRARIPMGRFGSPLDIARVIHFLLSDAAAYVTGQVIAVDGGMTAGDTSLASPSKEELAAVAD